MVTKALVPHATPEGCQTLKVSPSSLWPYYTPPSPLCYSSNLRRPCFSQIPLMASSLSVGIPSYWVPSLTSPLHSRRYLGWKPLPGSVLLHILSHQNLQHFTYPSKKIINYKPLEEYVVFLLCTRLNSAW